MSVSFESNKRINALKQGLEHVTNNRFADLTEGVQFVKDNYSEPIDYVAFISENGETEILPNKGYSFSKVIVHVNVENENNNIITGITDFTDFWADDRRMEIYDIVDTSEANIFDRALSGNTSIKPPKYMRVTNKVFSIESMFEGSAITELPDEFDISNCENCTGAFRNSKIAVLPSTFVGFVGQMPDIVDMSNVETAGSMCYSSDIKTFPFRNTGQVTTFRAAFYSCDFTEAELDLTSCVDMRSAFNNCRKLKKLTLRNTQQVTSQSWEACFTNCEALEDLSIDALNIVSNHLNFSDCEFLTVESLINIVNALSDNTGVYDTKGNPYSIKLGSDNIAKLKNQGIEDHQDELYYISIATNKNINLV